MRSGAFQWARGGLWLGNVPFPVGESGIRLDVEGLTAVRPYARSLTLSWDDVLRVRTDVAPGRPRSATFRERLDEAREGLSPLSLLNDSSPGWIRLEVLHSGTTHRHAEVHRDLSATTGPLARVDVAAVPLVLEAVRTTAGLRAALGAEATALPLLEGLSRCRDTGQVKHLLGTHAP